MPVSRAAVAHGVAALLLLAGASSGAHEIPADLKAALRDFDRAHCESDIPTLERLTSANYQVLNSNISRENKREFLADFRLPGFKIDPYERQQEDNVAWNDAAVTAGVVLLNWTQDGVHQARRLRYVDVWRRHAGRWQVTFTQVTRVPD
jgi:hypothetical protein